MTDAVFSRAQNDREIGLQSLRPFIPFLSSVFVWFTTKHHIRNRKYISGRFLGKVDGSISNRDSGKHCLVRIFFTKSVNQFSEEFLPYFVETCAILRDLLVGQYNFAERKASRSHCCLSLSPAPFFCSFYLLLTH